MQVLHNGYRFVMMPAYYSRVISTFRFGDNHHQFSTFTQVNGYPLEMAQKYFAKRCSS